MRDSIPSVKRSFTYLILNLIIFSSIKQLDTLLSEMWKCLPGNSPQVVNISITFNNAVIYPTQAHNPLTLLQDFGDGLPFTPPNPQPCKLAITILITSLDTSRQVHYLAFLETYRGLECPTILISTPNPTGSSGYPHEGKSGRHS